MCSSGDVSGFERSGGRPLSLSTGADREGARSVRGQVMISADDHMPARSLRVETVGQSGTSED